MHRHQPASAPFLGGLSPGGGLFLFHSRFYSGSVWLDGQSNFDCMKQALLSEFGQPSSRMVARQDVFKWNWTPTKIEVVSHTSPLFAYNRRYTNDAI